jgi:hypothetical protein
MEAMHKLARVLEGWDGYQTSLLHAVSPLTARQLLWRSAPDRRSVGELIRHIGLGRITWLSRICAPGMDAVAAHVRAGIPTTMARVMRWKKASRAIKPQC